MADLTFDIGLAVAAFISVFACFHSRQQLHLVMEEMRTTHGEILGEIQGILAGISGGAEFAAWYTTGLGLALMGGGAAVTIRARDAETGGGQMILFLAAGILLWMGVTCLIAAVVKTRRAAAR